MIDQTSALDSGNSEATGISRAWSFDEAFRDAVNQLGSGSPGTPDWLDAYVVIEIGARVGGVAGFNELYVRVSRPNGPSPLER